MPAFKPLLKFFGVFFSTYILLYIFLGLQPVNDTHRSFFMGICEAFLKTTLPKTHILLKENVREGFEEENQINIVYKNKEEFNKEIEKAKKSKIPGKRMFVDIQGIETTFLFIETVLMPFMFLLSLIIATPLGYKEKIKAILSGTLAFYFFILLKIWFYALNMISTSSIGVYEFETPLSSIVAFFGGMQIGASMMFVVLIWLLVAVRKSNWQNLIASMTGTNNK